MSLQSSLLAYIFIHKLGAEIIRMLNDHRKIYYSEALDRYILIDNQFTPLQVLKGWKKKFCELNNIPLDKVIVFDGSVDYETIDQNYGLISWMKNHNDTNNLPSWED